MTSPTSNNNIPDSVERVEMRELITMMLDDGLSEREQERLYQMLERSPDLLNEYVNQIQIDTMLEWCSFEANNQNTPYEREVLVIPSKQQQRRSLVQFVSISVCLSVLLVLGLFFYQQPIAIEPVDTPTRQQVAVLLDSEDAIWQEHNSALPFGTHFYSGERLILDSGIVRLALTNGAGLVLEGPCDLELTTDRQTHLHYGTLAAIVPKEATHFSLLTQNIRIADTGANFGTTVSRNKETEVHVFEGQITVESRDANFQASSARIKLKSNDSFRFAENSAVNQTAPNSNMPTLQFPDMPDKEQIAVAMSGIYPPKPRLEKKRQSSTKPFELNKQDSLSAIPEGVLYAEQFSYPGTNLDQALGGKGFAPYPWQSDAEFVRIFRPSTSLQWGKLTGGSYTVELSGRHPAYPKLANRISRKLPIMLDKDFYFSFLGRYHGLDEDDFFACWFDNRNGFDLSHSNAPNVGFKNGTFFARFNVDAEQYAQIAPEGKTFFIVGRLTKEGTDHFNRLALWCNPPADGLERAPDVVSEFRSNISKFDYFSSLGIRIGAYTEPEDRLMLDRLVIGSRYEQVTQPAKQKNGNE